MIFRRRPKPHGLAARWLPLIQANPALVYQVAAGVLPTRRGSLFTFADQSFVELSLPARLPEIEEVSPYVEVVE